jgi:hypothetical protein
VCVCVVVVVNLICHSSLYSYSYTHREAVRAVRWADDGSLTYLSVSWDGTLQLHSLTHLTETTTTTTTTTQMVTSSSSISLSVQNNQIAANDSYLKTSHLSNNLPERSSDQQ